MKNITPTTLRFLLYVRKSSESEDRQVQSIEDQTERLTELAAHLGIQIIKIFEESKSAKLPNNRPVFAEMLKCIEQGEADGILCWKLNRLSRNPVDSGRVQWMLQQGVLKSIQTYDREYRPKDNVILFNVETGQANQYILDLSADVTRGIEKRLNKGIMPCCAPTGYINTFDKDGEKVIIPDPERFHLVRKMWDMMLTGNYNPPQILKIVNDQWGFRTIKKKKVGDKPLSRVTIYKIFTSLFYAGIIDWSKQQYQGTHKTMVTLEEYDRVQQLLGRKGKTRQKTHEFAFTGVIRCGECGCMVTAEHKTKYIKNTKETKQYTYYHCTKKRFDYKCSQSKNIRLEKLEEQIDSEIQKISILPEFCDWALDILKEENQIEVTDRTQIQQSVNKSLESTQKQLDKLTDFLLRELIDEHEFKKKKLELQKQMQSLKSDREQVEHRAAHWQELTEKTFKFSRYASYHFAHRDLRKQKEIFSALGQNFLLKDGKLTIELNEWLVPIQQDYKVLEKEYLKLEPTERCLDKTKNTLAGELSTSWWSITDSNR